MFLASALSFLVHLVTPANVPVPVPAPAAAAASAPAATTPAAPATTPAAPTPTPTTTKPDPKLDAVVDAIQRTYDGTTDFSGSFVQKYTYTLLRRTQESKGTVKFKKPGLMRWDYTAPQPKAFVVDGKSLWISQPADHNAFINACFQQDGLTASVAFLWGAGKIKEQFDVKWFDGVFGDKTDTHLELSPRQANAVFAKLILVVDPKTNRVKQSVVVDPSGNVNQFIYGALKFNQSLADKDFAFTPPPDAHVARLPGSCDAPVPGLTESR